MPFEKDDARINRAGRPPSDKPKTVRSKRETELRRVLNRLRPLVADAIATAAELMNQKKGVSDAVQLKAAMFLIQEYQKLVMELEKEDAEIDAPVQQAPAPLFSMKQQKVG